MKQRNIGETSWEASAVALGIMRMNKLTSDQAVKTIEAAYDSGINFIDAADVYGNGDSEKIFGEALKKSNISRDDLYIQSKGGIIADTRYDFSKQHLIDAVNGSLKRLGVDYLDSFLLHRPDPLMEPEEIAEAFDELQTSGKVRHFGVSNFNPLFNPQQYLMVQEAVSQRLIINQLQFSIMHTGMVDFGMHSNMNDSRSINHDGGILEFSRRMGVTIQAWSPFQYGFFDGVFINSDKFPELNQKLQGLADKYGVSKNGIATAWILRHPADMQVIIGTMNPEHIIDSAKGADVDLTKQEWYDIYFASGNDLP